ncbi:type I inositol polyphosphate 5-phosphatase 10-like isoform X3 [Dioscorea cayenensis subsp. rotundata]|uniref:Type I inositol polyphosphate 5-phosphatase 10-like isoform X3 n=1 Tax=Dioscorea cayennensis subsp. rotundata TaxID=55577 RepID=A0AB40BXZ2_DIOCR|nr:type I inositol polyphosphate 5-phosphatase 10-like isoform X3 [Dioscorea cayenensis subsp. rotundata]
MFLGNKEKKMSKETDNSFSAELGESHSFSETGTSVLARSFSDSNPSYRSMEYSSFPSSLQNTANAQTYRIFVATWNVGGKTPHGGLNLNDFLPADDPSDIYVLGFQEIVPLNAGNVLVIEDNEPATKWLGLINQALNRTQETDAADCMSTQTDYSFTSPANTPNISTSKDLKSPGNLLFFQKPSLKAVSRSFRIVQGRRLKSCNCPSEVSRKYYRDSCFGCQQAYTRKDDSSEDEAEEPDGFMVPDLAIDMPSSVKQQKYSLIASKQMVGIFVTVWLRRELVPFVGHLRISCVGRGIMGCLGNKGCISVSLSLHQTSFCFVCSHLASGEKEGDERRRNSDVIEILKNTQFPRICRSPSRRVPEKILGHDRIIWLGDLNYRIALSYSETRKLLEYNDWDALFKKDQLKIEIEAGRVFKGWKEGKIFFPPTYKYSDNSDAYAGEVATSKKKRRTPAWCDRILWHGDGIVQLCYICGESRFSDHRPVCAVFSVEVGVPDARLRNGLSTPNMKVGVEELLSSGSSDYFPH